MCSSLLPPHRPKDRRVPASQKGARPQLPATKGNPHSYLCHHRLVLLGTFLDYPLLKEKNLSCIAKDGSGWIWLYVFCLVYAEFFFLSSLLRFKSWGISHNKSPTTLGSWTSAAVLGCSQVGTVPLKMGVHASVSLAVPHCSLLASCTFVTCLAHLGLAHEFSIPAFKYGFVS